MHKLRPKTNILILFVLVLSLLIYWWPQNIDHTYAGYATSYDGEVDEAVTVQISGQLHRRLLTRHRFEGQLIIDEVSMPARFGVPGSFSMMLSEFKERWTGNTLSSDILTLDTDNYTLLHGRLMLTPNLRHIGGFAQDLPEFYEGQNINFAAPAGSRNDVNRVIWELSQRTPFPGD